VQTGALRRPHCGNDAMARRLVQAKNVVMDHWELTRDGEPRAAVWALRPRWRQDS
jgi:hypothetical protein